MKDVCRKYDLLLLDWNEVTGLDEPSKGGMLMIVSPEGHSY